MDFNTITSANSTAILQVESLFPSGIVLEQFSIDQSIIFDEVNFTENRIGVDGKMASGFVPSIKSVNVFLEASSPSFPLLCQLGEVMSQNKCVYACTLVVNIPSIKKVYTFSNGVLKSGRLFPDNKKTLEPVNFRFEFESFKSSEI